MVFRTGLHRWGAEEINFHQVSPERNIHLSLQTSQKLRTLKTTPRVLIKVQRLDSISN